MSATVTEATEQCAPACPTLLRSLGQHASGCCHYVNPYGKAWCPDCRRRVQIEDQYSDDTGDSRAITEVWSVTDLTCGHQASHKVSEYRSPLQQSGVSRAYVLGMRAELVDSPW